MYKHEQACICIRGDGVAGMACFACIRCHACLSLPHEICSGAVVLDSFCARQRPAFSASKFTGTQRPAFSASKFTGTTAQSNLAQSVHPRPLRLASTHLHAPTDTCMSVCTAISRAVHALQPCAMPTSTDLHSSVCMHVWSHAFTCTHMHRHTYTQTCAHVCTCTCIRAQMHCPQLRLLPPQRCCHQVAQRRSRHCPMPCLLCIRAHA